MAFGARIARALAGLLPEGGEAQRVSRNVGWMVADRGFRLLLGLVVNVWVVRYLGAEPLGLMSFAQSLVVIAAVVSQLGLETIVVRDLVRRPDAAGRVIGTALALRLSGAFGTLALAAGAAALLRPGDTVALALAAIFATTAFSQAFDVLEFWFQSVSRIGPAAVARTVAATGGAGLKIAAIVSGAPVAAVALAIAGEFALSALALVFAYRRVAAGVGPWSVSAARARELLGDSWPLFVNSIAIVIAVRVDQMLITTLRGTLENGWYAAAQRLTEVLFYLPTAALVAANPVLLRSHAADTAEYERRLQRLFSTLALAGLAIAAGVSLLAGPVVTLLFGREFAPSGPVLAILVWSCPALFLGVAQTNWFIAHGRQRALMARSLAAAAASVAMNLALVPAYGARGAAVSLLVSQVFAQILLNACFAETRGLFRMQLRALLPFLR